MSQVDPMIISFLSLTIALLAIFIGPLISWMLAKKQIESSVRIARQQVLNPMRQAWINTLRELIAEVASSCLHYWQTGFEDRSDKEYKRITDIEHKIQLMINPNEELHQKLIEHVKKMVQALSKGKEGDNEFFAAYNSVISIGQSVLKLEWNVVKET